MKIQIPEPEESRSGKEAMTPQRLASVDGDPKNRSYIDSSASLPISTCKFTKNRSYIDSGASIPISTCKFTMIDYSKDVIVEASEELKNSHSHYSGNNQLSQVDIGSPSLPVNDTELLYCHIAKLLFASKRARPNIQACVASLFTRVELPRNYYKNIHLNIDLSFVNKIQILLMLFQNGRSMYFKILLYKHNKHI